MATMKSFDPYTQTFEIFLADGVTPVTVAIPDVNAIYYENSSACILYGTELGASLLMFLVVAILTKESKRKSLLYALNLLSLFLSFLRSLLLALYFTGPWSEFYAVFATDYSAVPRSAYATSIAGDVIPLLLTTTVNASLVLQAHTVCKNLNNTFRYCFTALSTLVFLLAVGFRFGQTVEDSQAVMTAESFYYLQWIHTGALVMETISIWYFSIIFTSKLLFTLYTRRRNGWKQWSAVRILATMGGCTMVIPSIFAILEYTEIDSFPKAGTLALTTVALLLPLSSLWAGMVTDAESASLNLSHLSGSKGSSMKSIMRKDSAANAEKINSISSSPSQLEFLSERKSGAINPSIINTIVEGGCESKSQRDSTELDLEAMGVRVDHTYGVHNGHRRGGDSMV